MVVICTLDGSSQNYQAVEQAEYDRLIQGLKNADSDLEFLSEPTDLTSRPTEPATAELVQETTTISTTTAATTTVPTSVETVATVAPSL